MVVGLVVIVNLVRYILVLGLKNIKRLRVLVGKEDAISFEVAVKVGRQKLLSGLRWSSVAKTKHTTV